MAWSREELDERVETLADAHEGKEFVKAVSRFAEEELEPDERDLLGAVLLERAEEEHAFQEAARRRAREPGWWRRTVRRVEDLVGDSDVGERAGWAAAAVLEEDAGGIDAVVAELRADRGRAARVLDRLSRHGDPTVRGWVASVARPVLDEGSSYVLMSLTRAGDASGHRIASALAADRGGRGRRPLAAESRRRRLAPPGRPAGDPGADARTRSRPHACARRRGATARDRGGPGGAGGACRGSAGCRVPRRLPGRAPEARGGTAVNVRRREDATAFTTLDGSTIRVLLDARFGGALKQSLAEATLEPGQATQRHYHARTEEIYEGDEARVAVLLADEPELNLFEAAALGRTELVAAPLDADASAVEAFADDGFTALHLAAFFRHPETARLLVERGAPVDVVARHETIPVTPLQSAVTARQEETAALLLERGANPNGRHGGGFTPFHTAAQHGDVPLVELLLRHGADPALAADDGRRAADFASEGGHEELAARLGG